MADHGRYDLDERRARESGGRGSSIFGPGWRGRDRDRRDDPGYERSRNAGWFDEGLREDGGDRNRMHGAGRERERSRDSRGGGRHGRGRDYGYDDRHEGLPIDETSRLIASNKVEGTPVYSRDGERLGTVYNFMVDKVSGQVEYAVMSYGGFLGMGQRYYPLPWRVLTYHTDAGGYVINMRARDFEDAPSFGREDEPEFDSSYGRRVHGWYGLEY